MGFLKPKLPPPPSPQVLTPQNFSPAAATAVRPASATGGSNDSTFGTGRSYINSGLAPIRPQGQKRSLLGGGIV